MSTFPNDNYNHGPSYHSKYSGEEIDNILDTVKDWLGSNNTNYLVVSTEEIENLQNWWSTVLSTSNVNVSDAKLAISGPALLTWWNEKVATTGSWGSVANDKVVTKRLIQYALDQKAWRSYETHYTCPESGDIQVNVKVKDNIYNPNNSDRIIDNANQALLLLLTNGSSSGTDEIHLSNVGFFSAIGIESTNPFDWLEEGEVDSSWEQENTQLFCATEVYFPTIYVSTNDATQTNENREIAKFHLVNKVYSEDKREYISLYKGYLYLDNDYIPTEDSNPIVEKIHDAWSNGSSLLESYIILTASPGQGSVIVTYRLRSMFS